MTERLNYKARMRDYPMIENGVRAWQAQRGQRGGWKHRDQGVLAPLAARGREIAYLKRRIAYLERHRGDA